MNKDELIFDLGARDLMNVTEGEFELLLERDRLLTEKNIVDKVGGIGSLKSEKYQDSLDVIDDMLDIIDEDKKRRLAGIRGLEVDDELESIIDDLESGQYDIAKEIHGIGGIAGKKKRKAKKAARKAKRKKRKAAKKDIKKTLKGKEKRQAMKKVRKELGTKAGKFLRKAAKVAKKTYTGMWKLATWPARLALKGILEVSLPKAAPSFLYLFIPEKDVSKMPATVQKKRKKQIFLSNFFVKWIGLKRKHFMKLISNGIKKHYGKSPEKLLKDRYQGISGIGVLPLALIPPLIAIVTKLMKVFKKGKKIKDDIEKVTGKGSLKEFGKLAIPDIDEDFKSGDGKDFYDTRLTPTEEEFDTTLAPLAPGEGEREFDTTLAPATEELAYRELKKAVPGGCMVLLTFLIIIIPVLVKFLFF